MSETEARARGEWIFSEAADVLYLAVKGELHSETTMLVGGSV